MKASEIKVGRHYQAKVSGKITTVILKEIKEYTQGPKNNRKIVKRYRCTNIETGRDVIMNSAAKFRSEVQPSITPVPKPKKVTSIDIWGDTLETPVTSPIKVTQQGVGPNPQNIDKPLPTKSEVVQKLFAQNKVKAPTTDTSPHLIIVARAGTGKTTTLIGGIQMLLGHTPMTKRIVDGVPTMVKLEPSKEQSEIWDCICLSRGKVQSLAIAAFNSPIAKELSERVPPGVEAKTMHSMGFAALRTAGIFEINKHRTSDIAAKLLGYQNRFDYMDKEIGIHASINALVSKAKMNLSDDFESLAIQYEIDLGEDWCNANKIFDTTRLVLEQSKVLNRPDDPTSMCMNFDDQIWLPVVLKLPLRRYDILMVDEGQDLNRCQHVFCKMVGRRLIICGDPQQAIYLFAGADSNSMKRLYTEFNQDVNGRKCVELKLTETRRCGKAIVKEVNTHVKDFTAHESNPEGKVSRVMYQDKDISYRSGVNPGDMVLARTNSVLVSECFKFLKEGKPAYIQGREIGDRLVSLVTKFKTLTVVDFINKLNEWRVSELGKINAKKNVDEGKIIEVEDKVSCLLFLTEELEANSPIQTLIDKITALFSDTGSDRMVRLSSIHKAKGLESRRVFFLQLKRCRCPHPMAKTAAAQEQEYNLLYVGITRAIEELIWVSGGETAVKPRWAQPSIT